MALTQLQKLELNKRVDKILNAPVNVTIKGQQPEMAFVLDLSSDMEYISDTLKDSAATLKAHDKIFQNIRSNIVYWGAGRTETKVTPMSFIQIGKATENLNIVKSEEEKGEQPKSLNEDGTMQAALNAQSHSNGFDDLCAYLKLYHARCRCLLLFTDKPDKLIESSVRDKAIESLNPFLKHRLLIITPEKMITGAEILMKLINLPNHNI